MMIKRFIKYRGLIATYFVLTPLLLWFFYSEVVQYTFKKEIPHAQDYCEVAQIIKAETGNTAASHLVKLKVEKTFCRNSFDEINLSGISLDHRVITHLKTPQRITQIYLYNRTFLI